ncbi:cupin domain-containing protein [Streptomyces sp. NPDC002138]|uniref:cupin domain-containing protein n=1 Tax=Streptomyces sp. NPDC002138 TaxID=3154410 RepID=UPI0033289ABD
MGRPKPIVRVAEAARRSRLLATSREAARPPAAAALADLVEREIVIAPGGSTGWHYHHVPLNAVVRSGTLTRILHDGTVEVNEAGDRFIERGGAEHVHLGHNRGAEPVVLHVTYALPEGLPLSVDAPAPRLLPAPPTPHPAGAHTRRRISPRTR